MKKTLHILVIAILALNLMGVSAFAASLECGMVCCESPDQAGAISFEAPSCCQLSDETCNYEPGQYQELIDTAICCHNGFAQKSKIFITQVSILGNIPDTPIHRYSDTNFSFFPPRSAPVYLSQATFLC